MKGSSCLFGMQAFEAKPGMIGFALVSTSIACMRGPREEQGSVLVNNPR
jgi:hypothetical protein